MLVRSAAEVNPFDRAPIALTSPRHGPCPARRTPGSRPRRARHRARPGHRAPRTSSAARWGRRGCGSRSGFGIVNEVYYPRVDIPQIRDLGFIVAGPDGFWSEVKRNAQLFAEAVGARRAGGRDRARARALPAAPAHHARPAARRPGHRMPARRRGRARPLRAARAASRRHRLRQHRDGRALWRAPRAVGRTGPVRHGARRGRPAAGRRFRPGQRRLCRRRATAGRISRGTAR